MLYIQIHTQIHIYLIIIVDDVEGNVSTGD